MRQLLSRLFCDVEGAALAEYGILIALIAVVCVVAVTSLGTQISTIFSKAASVIGTVSGA